MGQKLSTFEKRRQRVRTSIRARGGARPRLSIHRSGRHIYAQIIDDASGKTLAAASDADVKTKKGMKKSDVATEVGKLIAERAKEQKIAAVVFDRRDRRYHGRVKALAEGARAGGLQF